MYDFHQMVGTGKGLHYLWLIRLAFFSGSVARGTRASLLILNGIPVHHLKCHVQEPRTLHHYHPAKDTVRKGYLQ